ncbi:MAG: hypothetical protein R2707_07560 [Acidimicrobiales bacterium]
MLKLLVVATDDLDQEALGRRIDGYVHSDPPVDVYVVAAGDHADDLLEETITRVELLDASVAGEIGAVDLTVAVDAALSRFAAHRVLVSASPSRVAQWLHRDVPHRLQRRTKAIVESIAVPVGGGLGSGDGRPGS